VCVTDPETALVFGFASCSGRVYGGHVDFREMALVKDYVTGGRSGRTDDVRRVPSPMRGFKH
jgi:hypothetical protein